jgi:hypothetical protein
MSLKDALNAARHLVIEDDDTEKPSAPAAAPHPTFDLGGFKSPAPGGFAAAAAAPSPFSVPGTTVLDEKVYQSVLKKTNFDSTPVGKAIHKYYDALEGVILDQTQRFKAAIGQAQKLDGITPDQVLGTFDQLQAALDADAQGFQSLAASMEKNQITARQTKIADLQAQVSNLNSQIAQLQTELADEQAKHASAVTQYGLAQQRRAQEIAQQKSQFAALLH